MTACVATEPVFQSEVQYYEEEGLVVMDIDDMGEMTAYIEQLKQCVDN